MAECPSSENSVSNVTDSIPASLQTEVERLKFIAYGVISSVIIGLGILGNAINLAVLTRPNLKGVTFVYLTWLAISDLASLLVSLTSMFRLHGMQPKTWSAAVYYAHVEMPLVNACMASSVFLVVALTVDRYFSVCLPTRFQEVHNARRARTSIAAAYICAVLLYIPVCFQKVPVPVISSTNKPISENGHYISDLTASHNQILSNASRTIPLIHDKMSRNASFLPHLTTQLPRKNVYTDSLSYATPPTSSDGMSDAQKVVYIACDNLRVVSHPAFKIYLLVKEVLVRLGPVVLLAVMNLTIIVTFRKTVKKRRDLLSSQQASRDGNKKYREEQRLVILLFGIVVLFFVSMTPAAVLTILNSDDKEFHYGFQLFRAFANTLELSNYAMNFYVYCMCSSEIRRTFVSLVTCKGTPIGSASSGCSKPSLDSNNKY